MAYYLKRTDGTPLVTLQDRTMNSAVVPLTLIGRGVVNYGTAVSENFVRLLENFSAARAPETPISGQLWYNNGSGTLNLYSGLVWTQLASTDEVVRLIAGSAGSSHPVTLAGDITATGRTYGTISVTLAASGATPGTYTKAIVDAKGRVTAGLNITAQDIENALGYVPSPVPTSATAVSSVNSKSGAVILRVADIPDAAPLAAPQFTGAPHFTPVTSSIGGRFYIEGVVGTQHVILDNYQNKLRIFPSSGGNVLNYDLTDGSLYVPGGFSAGGAVGTTGTLEAGSSLLARRTIAVRSTNGSARQFTFQNDTGSNTGAIVQSASDSSIRISANADGGTGSWPNAVIIDTAGAVTAPQAVSSLSGTLISRSANDRRLIFQTAAGANAGWVWQSTDNVVRISSNADASLPFQVNPDGDVLAARNVLARGGNLIVRSEGNGNLFFQNSAGTVNRGVVFWHNSADQLRLSANGDGSRPVSVTNTGDIYTDGWTYAKGFCFNEFGAKDTGIFSTGDGQWVARNNNVTRLISSFTDFAVVWAPNSTCTWHYQSDGNVVYYQNGAARWAVWNYTSDSKLKTNIRPWAGDSRSVVEGLRVVTFDWKDPSFDPDNATDQVGFIAQEVEQIVPAAVKTMDGTKLLNKAELVPHLTKAVQELSAENRDMRNRIERLEQIIEAMHHRLA